MILGADDTVGGVALAWDVAAEISVTYVQSWLFTRPRIIYRSTSSPRSFSIVAKICVFFGRL